MRSWKIVLAVLLSAVLVAALLACGSYYRYESGYGHPPPWEVGGGPYIRYYYYPDVHIYYRPDRHYYYYHHDREWRRAKRLPDKYQLRGGRVKLRMRDEEPFRWHGDVEKRFPPRGDGRRKW